MASCDLRSALRGALDVESPSFSLGSLQQRAIARAHRHRMRVVRSMTALGMIVALLAVFAGGQVIGNPPSNVAAVSPHPAPEPVPTS